MLQESEDLEYLYEQLDIGEDTYRDFKFTINDPQKIAKSIVAFANQKGGSLFIGVEDNGEIFGCRPKVEYHHFLDILEEYCHPIPEVDFYVFETEDGKDVLEASVVEGIKKPYAALNKKGDHIIYLRVDDKCKKIGKL